MEKKPVYKITFKEKCAQSKVGTILTLVGIWINVGLCIPMVAGNVGYGAIPLLIAMVTTAWPLMVVGLVLTTKGGKKDAAEYERKHGITPSSGTETPVSKEEAPIEEKAEVIPAKVEATPSKVEVVQEEDEEKQRKLAEEKEGKYQAALEYYGAKEYRKAAEVFKTILSYKDSKPLYNDCVAKLKEEINEKKYNKALDLIAASNYKDAYNAFKALGDYKDSVDKANACKEVLDEQKRKAKKKAVAIVCIIGGVAILCVGGVITLKIINKNRIAGKGTEDNPYQIKTIEQLMNANKADAYYKLMNDITLTDADLDAIINVNYNLDGNGKTLSYEGKDYSPLFDKVESNGSISNLKLTFRQEEISLTTIKDYALLIGTNDGMISKIDSDLDFNGAYTGSASLGNYPTLASISVNNGTIDDIYFHPTIKVTVNNSYIEVGGVCAKNYGTIKNSKTYSYIHAPGCCEYASLNYGTIDNCVSDGLATGEVGMKSLDVLAAGFTLINQEGAKVINSTSNTICTAKSGDGYHGYAAGVAFTNYGLLKNDKATTEVCATGNSGDSSNIFMGAAGICAYNYKDIEDCTFEGNLKSIDTGSAAFFLTGICAQNEGKISNCKFNAKYPGNAIRVTNSSGTAYVSCILTYNDSGSTCSGYSTNVETYNNSNTATIYFTKGILMFG